MLAMLGVYCSIHTQFCLLVLFPTGDILSILMAKFLIGTLLFIRVAALLFSGPLFSSMGIEPQVRIFISVLVAMSMTAVYGGEQPPLTLDVISLVLLSLKEVMVGSLIGYSSSMIINAARFAGGMLDVEVGFQTALLFDANAGVPTLLGEFKSMIILMVFLAVNGHHFLLEAVFASARLIPIDSFTMGISTIDAIIRMVTSTMILAVKIASPVLVALFLTNIALALLARVAPQINIFALSMQAKVAIGLVALFITAPLVVLLMKEALAVFQGDVMSVLMSITKTGQLKVG